MKTSYTALCRINLKSALYIEKGDMLIFDPANKNNLTIYRNGSIVKTTQHTQLGLNAMIKTGMILPTPATTPITPAIPTAVITPAEATDQPAITAVEEIDKGGDGFNEPEPGAMNDATNSGESIAESEPGSEAPTDLIPAITTEAPAESSSTDITDGNANTAITGLYTNGYEEKDFAAIREILTDRTASTETIPTEATENSANNESTEAPGADSTTSTTDEASSSEETTDAETSETPTTDGATSSEEASTSTDASNSAPVEKKNGGGKRNRNR
jgi:hypothetical protein